ncbi:permease-like cell division protein FtsX [Microtetraspora malaysiensis]|uniref:permease-like cell division protein FtsX n=1 Tax=Microtetraspora malaysiensis TaxID=161358 RepID=UPI003D930977
MDLSSDIPESEELSFGKEPTREPRATTWLRRRAARDGSPRVWKPVAVALSMVVLLAGAAGGARDPYDRGRWPLPPPDVPWPETGTFLLHLCDDARTKVWETCEGGGAVTDEERWVIERTLASLPEITSYGRTTPEESLAIARQDHRVGDVLTVDLMRDSYGGTLGRGDWRALLRTLGDLPGVGVPTVFRDDFWWGKADVSVALCPETSLYELWRICEEHGLATASEKEAVYDRIRRLPGIEKIYAEDPAHAAKARNHISWQMPFGDGPLDDLPETFYIKLADPGTAARIEKAVAGMSGVARVRKVAPVAAP